MMMASIRFCRGCARGDRRLLPLSAVALTVLLLVFLYSDGTLSSMFQSMQQPKQRPPSHPAKRAAAREEGLAATLPWGDTSANIPLLISQTRATSRARVRQPVITVGVPTITRPTKTREYLFATLDSLVKGCEHRELEKGVVSVVVFVADAGGREESTQALLSEIAQRYPSLVASGALDLVRAHPSFYPKFDEASLPPNYDDPLPRRQWRSKQCVDYALLVNYAVATHAPQYYLQMEDDVLANRGWPLQISSTVGQHAHGNWVILAFSPYGFIGKLLRAADAADFASFTARYYNQHPVDLLMYLWQVTRYQFDDVKNVPKLFHHIGKESSLVGKTQFVEAPTKVEVAQDGSLVKVATAAYDNGNPIATATCSVGVVVGDPLAMYGGDGLVRLSRGEAGEYCQFTFAKPHAVSSITVKTGEPGTSTGRISGASLLVSADGRQFERAASFGVLGTAVTKYVPRRIVAAMRIAIEGSMEPNSEYVLASIAIAT